MNQVVEVRLAAVFLTNEGGEGRWAYRAARNVEAQARLFDDMSAADQQALLGYLLMRAKMPDLLHTR